MTESIQIIIAIVASIAFASVSLYFLFKQQTQYLLSSKAEAEAHQQALELEIEGYRDQLTSLKESLAVSKSRLEYLNQLDQKNEMISAEIKLKEQKMADLQAELQGVKSQFEERTSQLAQLNHEMAELRTELKSKNDLITQLRSKQSGDEQAKQAQQEKIELLEKTEQRLTKEFENLANKIFKEKSGVITEQNKTSLDSLLTPLKDQIGQFSEQVNRVYVEETKERHALAKEVSGLKELNERMSKEAVALTRALKGDNKKQGTWGEVVLERVLKESGLREGHEYRTQKGLKDEDGKTFKPDVIVHLPGDKDVVVDSKVALVAYERYYNAEDDAAKAVALKGHIKAVKDHIKGLSSKNYQDLHGIKTLDYVLMFIPVEPAFNVALENDSELVQLALEKNIMLVSPTNLMVALKTINNMWRVEYQNQNAQDIAYAAGKIYDKLAGFVEDMEKLGRNLKTAEGSYADAMKKLSHGRGNLIGQAEKMKQLRIGNKKQLPDDLVEKSEMIALVSDGTN